MLNAKNYKFFNYKSHKTTKTTPKRVVIVLSE